MNSMHCNTQLNMQLMCVYEASSKRVLGHIKACYHVCERVVQKRVPQYSEMADFSLCKVHSNGMRKREILKIVKLTYFIHFS